MENETNSMLSEFDVVLRSARSLNARINSGVATLLPPRTASLIRSVMTPHLRWINKDE